MSAHVEALKAESPTQEKSTWKDLYMLGSITALIMLMYSLVTMVILVTLGGQPVSAQEGFTMLHANRLVGLLRLDVLSILIMPLYYLLFFALYSALNGRQSAYVKPATIFIFAGLTLFLATPSAFSWLALSNKFVVATNQEQRTLLLAAGEAILASDMWHGSGAMIGGLMLQAGALLISVAMLGSKTFSNSTAYVGIVMHGLDLVHILVGFFFPMGGVILMAIAGPLYLIWFPLLARDFFKLARSEKEERK